MSTTPRVPSWATSTSTSPIPPTRHIPADAAHPRLRVHLVPESLDATITVMLDAPDATRGGKALGTITLAQDTPRWQKEWTIDVPNLKGVKGKHALFFVFHSATPDKSICELHDFQFMK